MALNVYYSVCPFGTGNLLTGGSPTITVDGSGNAVLTLSGASQVDNIGIGVAVSYNSITSYISEITSATSFKLVSAIGVTASSQTSTAVTSINHEYASLSAFEAGFTDTNHINNTDLTVADVVVNACCYYDHDDFTADNVAVTISGFTADATRFLKVFTPTGGNESINNQKHLGVWDNNKYRLERASNIVLIAVINTELFGLQIYPNGAPTFSDDGVKITGAFNDILIDTCIIRGNGKGFGIGIGTRSDVVGLNIVNCVLYDWDTILSSSFTAGLNGTYEFLNCTAYNANNGMIGNSRTAGTCKNSAIFNVTGTVFSSVGTIDYCATDAGDGTNAVTITQSASDYAALVTDAPNGDFSLTDSTSELYNAGTNTGAPATDIIGTARPQSTTVDIGAFELIVGGGTDNLVSTDIETGNPVLETPSINQVHSLSAVSIVTGNPTLESPSIGQIHILTSSDITTGNPTLENPTIKQIHVLIADGFTTGNPVLENATLGQIHNLESSDIVTGSPILGNPTLGTGTNNLIATDIETGNPVLENPPIRQIHVLISSDIITGSPILESPIINNVIYETPAERTFNVPFENRTFNIPFENRTLNIPYENRIYNITGE